MFSFLHWCRWQQLALLLNFYYFMDIRMDTPKIVNEMDLDESMPIQETMCTDSPPNVENTPQALSDEDDPTSIIEENIFSPLANYIKEMNIQDDSEMQSEQTAPLYDNDLEPITLVSSTQDLFTTDQYLVGCKWSPDGSCLLTNCADWRHRLFDFPSNWYARESKDEIDCLKPSLTVANGGMIFDYEWYPHMSSWSPETCCFLSASSASPVHLLDAFTGQIQASYKGLNNTEEIVSAYSVKFSVSGHKIYCGYTHCLKIFDTSIPGSKCFTLNLKHLYDQRGLISCISENPVMGNLLAVGSYARTIGLYTKDGDGVCILKGHKNGLTHLMHSLDGSKLYSGARRDNQILCWDLRNPGKVLYVINRNVETNQRIYFDMSPDGKYLMTGGTDGKVLFYNLEKEYEEHCFIPNNDCTNGVSFNPRFPIIATSSGKRSYVDLVSDDDDENLFQHEKKLDKIENRVKFWCIGKTRRF